MVGDETGASSVSIGVISTHESAIDHMGTHSGGLIEATVWGEWGGRVVVRGQNHSLAHMGCGECGLGR